MLNRLHNEILGTALERERALPVVLTRARDAGDA